MTTQINVIGAAIIGGAVAYQISRCIKETNHSSTAGFDLGYYAIKRDMVLTANKTSSSNSRDNNSYFRWYRIFRF